MKRFEFSLQQVLELRRHERVEAERELARIQKKIRHLEKTARQIRDRLDQSLQEGVPERASPREFRRRTAHRQSVQADFREVAERIEALREKEANARAELVDRRKAEESLEELKEQEKEAHAQRAEEAHQKLMDEQALTRFARRDSSRRT